LIALVNLSNRKPRPGSAPGAVFSLAETPRLMPLFACLFCLPVPRQIVDLLSSSSAVMLAARLLLAAGVFRGVGCRYGTKHTIPRPLLAVGVFRGVGLNTVIGLRGRVFPFSPQAVI